MPQQTVQRQRALSACYRTEWYAWRNMISRCYSANRRDFIYYGNRGIAVCERWRHSFSNFLTDMGPRPTSQHSLDRINNDGNYAPDNCRWATPTEQRRNKRGVRLLTYDGLTLTASAWAERIGVSNTVMNARLNRLGWSIERALTTGYDARADRWK